MQGADLRGADLNGADLSNADLHGALLQAMKLQGAIGVTRDQLETAKVTSDEATRLLEELHGSSR